MKKNIKIIFSFVVLFLIICIISILKLQESMFFHPWHDEISYNFLKEKENFEEINIDNNGKNLNGWLKYNASSEIAPLVIFFLR